MESQKVRNNYDYSVFYFFLISEEEHCNTITRTNDLRITASKIARSKIVNSKVKKNPDLQRK